MSGRSRRRTTIGRACAPVALAAALLAVALIPAAAHAVPVFQLKWGSQGSADGQFRFPAGVATDAAGNVYVADLNNNRVQRFTATGGFLGKWGFSGGGEGRFQTPAGIATDAAGNVYVADTQNHRVQKFDQFGTFERMWGWGVKTGLTFFEICTLPEIGTSDCHPSAGLRGSGDGQFDSPTGIATDAAGNVYVADRDNHRVQKFNATGQFIRKWGTPGGGNGQFSSPNGIATNAVGVYVADTFNHRVQRFSNVGTFLGKWGTSGSGNRQFANPLGIATDAAGFVYVADTNNHRVQKFNAGGAFVEKWGTFGLADGQFRSPYGIATDAAGSFYVADQNNHRVQVFAEPAPPPRPPAPAAVLPSNDFRLGKLKRKERKGIAFLFVHLPGPGEIGLAGPGIKPIPIASAARSTSGGRVKLKIRPDKKGKKARKLRIRLRNNGKAKRRIRVTYAPTGGLANTKRREVKLVRKR